jgi:hypothetical protein
MLFPKSRSSKDIFVGPQIEGNSYRECVDYIHSVGSVGLLVNLLYTFLILAIKDMMTMLL